MAFLILARVIKQTFVINGVVNDSRCWIFTVDGELYGDFWRVLLTWLDSKAKNIIFFSFSFWRCWFSPCCEEILCFFSVHIRDYCLLLLASMRARGSNSVYFHSWVAWKEFCQRDVAVSTSAVLFQCLLRVPICVSSQGNMSLLHVQIKILAFQLSFQIKGTTMTVESRVSQDSWHSTFSFFVFFFFLLHYTLFLIFLVSCKIWRATVS